MNQNEIIRHLPAVHVKAGGCVSRGALEAADLRAGVELIRQSSTHYPHRNGLVAELCLLVTEQK